VEAFDDQFWYALSAARTTNAANGEPHALTEEELLRTTLYFLNAPTPEARAQLLAGHTAPEAQWLPMVSFDFGIGYGSVARDLATKQQVEAADRRAIDALLPVCECARTDLHAIINGSVTAQMENRLIRNASQVVALPIFEIDRRALVTRYRYVAKDVVHVLDHALLLLMDCSRPYGRNLCCCSLESCRKFFLADRTKRGVARTKYCCAEHMKTAHKAGGAARAERSRKNRAMAAEKRRAAARARHAALIAKHK
jgi:hypothetical protein